VSFYTTLSDERFRTSFEETKKPTEVGFLRCYSAITAEKICHLVTSKRRFTGEGPNEAHVTALTCSTPGLVQSHTPLGKV